MVFGIISVVLAGIGLQYSFEQLVIARAATAESSSLATCPPCSTIIGTMTTKLVTF